MRHDPLEAPTIDEPLHKLLSPRHQLTEEELRQFRSYAAMRSLFLIRIIITTIVAGLLLFWPMDRLILPDALDDQRTFHGLRIGLSLICVLYMLALRFSHRLQRNPSLGYLVCLSAASGVTGSAVASVGGLDEPWFYFGYCMSGMTVAALIPIRQRVFAALFISGIWSVGFFGTHVEHFVAPLCWAVLGVQLIMTFCSIAAGHGLYTLVQQNWLQREFIRSTFGRYFSDDVAEAVLRAHSGEALAPPEERHVTVLFSDLQGYSTIVERLEPAEVVEILNRYFEAMQVVIELHGGTVLEYVGDGIVVVFGAPMDLPDHADRAVRCARLMRVQLEVLNEAWEREEVSKAWTEHGISRLRARCGVHTGRVVAGSFGGERFMKYGVIGDAVNVAARLEALNKQIGTSILISEQTQAELTSDLLEELEDRGETALKGRAERVQIYSI